MQEYEGSGAAFYDYFEHGQPGDSRFYLEEAQRAGSPVLELGCGTGRTLIPVAQAGIDVVGVDLSPGMLSIAEKHLAGFSGEVRDRVELVHGDMRSFSLDQQFNLITIPNRSFLHLLTTDDQRQALTRIHDHLKPDGRFVLNIFDPHLEWIVEDHRFPESPLRKHGEFIHSDTGNRVVVWATREYDTAEQIIRQDYVFEEVDGTGRSVCRSYSSLTLRYVYRYEMLHLLELCGFQVESLFGNFQRSTFRHGGEQIWVCRRK